MITIPKSIAEAKASLAGIGALLKAKEWERAAIVYAFTHDGQGERTDLTTSRENPQGLTIKQFAELGIVGLQDRNTVAEYRKAWQSAIDDGQAVPVEPGNKVELPTLPWPPGFLDHKRGNHKTEAVEVIRKMIKADPKEAIDTIMSGQPTLARDVATGVLSNPMTRNAIEAQLAPPIEPTVFNPQPVREVDYREDLVRGTNLLIRVIYAIQRGEFTPTTTQMLLLHAIGLLVAQAQAQTPESQSDDLFDQINTYLNAVKEG